MSLDTLSATDISKFLAQQAVAENEFNIIVEESIPSTNDYLMELVSTSKEQLPKTAVLAGTQTAGKGRQGRSWVSVPGNVLLSVYWPFAMPLDKLYGLSLVVGIAVARVLKTVGLVDVQLKWPNDIYWQGRKMGGILIETKQNRPGVIDTVIGLGLNIVDMEQYAKQIEQKFVSLENALQRKIYLNKLVAQLLLELNTVLSEFAAGGFEQFIEEWKSLDSKIASNSIDIDDYSKLLSAEKLMKIDKKDGKPH